MIKEETFKEFIKLFDELLKEYKETKKKLLFETEYGINEKTALYRAVSKFKNQEI